MLGFSLKEFNKQYQNDLVRLFSTLTQAKDTLKVPEEYKGDKFDKFVSQLLNYTLSGNYELNEPIPKSDIDIPQEIFSNFFSQNPQLIAAFLYVLVYKDRRLNKLLKNRYTGTKEEIAISSNLSELTFIWLKTGGPISAKEKALYEILRKRNL